MTTPNPTREYYAQWGGSPPQELEPTELGAPGAEPREKWRRVVIDGLTTNYEVSDYGRVINAKGQLMTIGYPGGPHSKYGWVGLSVDGKSKPYRVDKLVLRAHAPDADEDGLVPVHINNNPRDCRIGNLVWAHPKDVPTPPAAKTRKARKVRRSPTTTPKGGDQVEMTRVYQLHDMLLAMKQDGSGKLILGEDWEPVELTATQISTLVTLLGRAGEMNRVFGGK